MSLGMNVSRWDGNVVDALKKIEPNFMVVATPDWDMLKSCRDAFSTTVLYRYSNRDPNNNDNRNVPAEALAQATIAETEHWRYLIDAYQAYNECWESDNVIEQSLRELKYVSLMQSQGLPVIAGNFGVGKIEAEHIKILISLWKTAAGMAFHGYCADGETVMDPPSVPWFLRRPEQMWLPVLQNYGISFKNFFVTETGTYREPFAGLISPEDYANLCIQIHEYCINRGMAATAPFTMSAFNPFEHWQMVGTGAVEILAQYNAQRPSRPPKVTIPASTAPVKSRSQQQAPAKELREVKLPLNKLDIKWVGSPNYGYPGAQEGRGKYQISAIVDHIGDGYMAGFDKEFLKPDNVSAHFAVGRNGEIRQYVSIHNAAWGAGRLGNLDRMPWVPEVVYQDIASGGDDINQLTINIEHEGFPGNKFTEEQIQASVTLHKWLLSLPECSNVKIDRDHIIGHYRLDPRNRKNCPGPTFFWDRLFAELEESNMDKQRVATSLDFCWNARKELLDYRDYLMSEMKRTQDLGAKNFLQSRIDSLEKRTQEMFMGIVAIKEEVGLQAKQ